MRKPTAADKGRWLKDQRKETKRYHGALKRLHERRRVQQTAIDIEELGRNTVSV